MLVVILNNGLFLPSFQPEISRNPTVVLIHTPIALLPLVELAGPNAQPGDELPTPISVFSDQRRKKSTTSSRVSWGTQLLVRAPQDFFLKPRARPSTRPRPRPWIALSFPRTQCAFASPQLAELASLWTQTLPLRFRRTPSANGRKPWVAMPFLRKARKPALCLGDDVSGWRLSLRRCNAYGCRFS